MPAVSCCLLAVLLKSTRVCARDAHAHTYVWNTADKRFELQRCDWRPELYCVQARSRLIWHPAALLLDEFILKYRNVFLRIWHAFLVKLYMQELCLLQEMCGIYYSRDGSYANPLSYTCKCLTMLSGVAETVLIDIRGNCELLKTILSSWKCLIW
jgi:hypothetical protein